MYIIARMDVERLEAQFGDRVRQLRIADGVSQADLARRANVSRSAIGNLESGSGSSLRTIIKALRALGRSEWILTLEAPDAVFNPLDLLDQPPAPRKGQRRVSRSRARGTQ